MTGEEDVKELTSESTSVELKVTQNGKTRNFIKRVVEVFDVESDNENSQITLSATGRCISKLVKVVEMSKILIQRDIHQYSLISIADSVEEDDEDSAQLKSQLVITLSRVQLEAANPHCSYQFHSGSGRRHDGNEDVRKKTEGLDQIESGKSKKSKHSKRRKLKKRNLEDSKNILL